MQRVLVLDHFHTQVFGQLLPRTQPFQRFVMVAGVDLADRHQTGFEVG
jgi:hypothetical protein